MTTRFTGATDAVVSHVVGQTVTTSQTVRMFVRHSGN